MKEIDNDILERFLDGKGEEGDKEKILNWFSDIRAESRLRSYYKEYWDKLSQGTDFAGYNESATLDRIYHQIKLDESVTLSDKKKSYHSVISIFSKIAAVLFIPLLAYVLIDRNNSSYRSKNISWVEVHSPPGTRSAFYLPDGTSGWLNSGSNLKFPAKFSGKTREVILSGEAFFDVYHDPQRPFNVSGKNFRVEAHGTSFDVLAYPREQNVRVTLLNGVVKVLSGQNGSMRYLTTLSPDQMCTFNSNASEYNVVPVDAKTIAAWTQGKLIFRNVPFTEVVRRINRWYNVNLVIKDDILKSYKYKATFEDEDINEVLKLLRLSAPIRYRDLGRERKTDGTFAKRMVEIYYKP